MSQPLLVSIPHRLGRSEARRRLDSGVGRLRPELNALLSGLDYHWEGDTLNFVASAMWQRITGRIEVLDDVVGNFGRHVGRPPCKIACTSIHSVWRVGLLDSTSLLM